MHKAIFITAFIILLFLQPVFADQEYHYAEDLLLRQDISNSVVITQTGNRFFIDHFDITLKLFPQSDDRQNIVNTDFDPEPVRQTSEVFFHWDKPTILNLGFSTSTTIKTSGKYPTLITDKVNFPLNHISSEALPYLEFTENINGNGDITGLASMLANNEDDLFMVEFALADWVNKNIKYNLSTITSEVNQPSSWVLDKRYGVCDEITNLFISLNRALGIPARFVSGIAYSDSILFTEKWGNHGWAEVYFPSHGWVPYDVTYNQLGYIDATHIALYKGIDGSDSSVEYSSVGRDYSFSQQGLEFNTQILDKGLKRSSITKVRLDVQEDPVAIGSYNLITVTVTNNNPYYVTDWFTLGKTTDLEIISQSQQRIALPPKTKTTLLWLVKVKENLDPDYYYTFPIVILDSLGDETKTNFVVKNTAEWFDKDYMSQFITVEKPYKTLSIDCNVPKLILLNNTAEATCFSSDQLLVCHEGDCQRGEKFTFDLDTSNIGVFTYKLNSADRIYFMTYKVSDISNIEITSISFPKEVNFGERETIYVRLNKTSWASPKNITLIVDHDLFSNKWSMDSINAEHLFEVTIPTTHLTLGKNTLKATVTYTDNTGQQKEVSKQTYTKLINLTFLEKVKVFFNTMGASLDKHLDKQAEKLHEKGIPESKLVVIVGEMIITLAIIFTIQRIYHKFNPRQN